MLREIINQFYKDREKEKEEKERIKFYISEVGKCPRSIFFKFKRAPKLEIEAERLRIFEMGNHIQQMILNPLISLGMVRAIEIPIPPQELISGRADVIISIEGKPYVVEVKSISGRISLEKKSEPIPEHYQQLQLYLHYFKIPEGYLIYVNKDTQEIRDYLVKYDQNLVEKILNWFQKLKSTIEADIVPLRLPDYPLNWQCEKCEYREICKIAGEKNINWEELKKKIESQNKVSEK